MRGLKALLGRSATTSLLAARAYALLKAIVALHWRLRVWPRAEIGYSVKVIGWRDVRIGKNVVIGARSWLNVNHRGNGDAIIIDDNVYIGAENFFSVGRAIRVGAYTLTASRCAFIGSSHLHSDPTRHYGSTSTSDQDVIDIGVNCFIGFGTTVMGNVRIGHGSVVGAHSFVKRNIPAFSVAAGMPARILKHYDFEANAWRDGERAGDAFVPDERDYLSKLRDTTGYPIQPLSAAAATFGDI